MTPPRPSWCCRLLRLHHHQSCRLLPRRRPCVRPPPRRPCQRRRICFLLRFRLGCCRRPRPTIHGITSSIPLTARHGRRRLFRASRCRRLLLPRRRCRGLWCPRARDPRVPPQGRRRRRATIHGITSSVPPTQSLIRARRGRRRTYPSARYVANFEFFAPKKSNTCLPLPSLHCRRHTPPPAHPLRWRRRHSTNNTEASYNLSRLLWPCPRPQPRRTGRRFRICFRLRLCLGTPRSTVHGMMNTASVPPTPIT